MKKLERNVFFISKMLFKIWIPSSVPRKWKKYSSYFNLSCISKLSLSNILFCYNDLFLIRDIYHYSLLEIQNNLWYYLKAYRIWKFIPYNQNYRNIYIYIKRKQKSVYQSILPPTTATTLSYYYLFLLVYFSYNKAFKQSLNHLHCYSIL